MPHYGEAKPGEGAYSQEHSNPHYKTHEELVAAYRAHIRVTEARLTLREPVPPWVWIRRDLYTKWENSPYRSEKQRFFKTLRTAWDVLIYDRFLEPGSATENTAGINISDAYKENPTIRLNEAQVRLLDALTEVAGITRPRGQNKYSFQKNSLTLTNCDPHPSTKGAQLRTTHTSPDRPQPKGEGGGSNSSYVHPTPQAA